MSRILKFILAANLLVLTALVFIYPQLMVGPGKLIPGHRDLEADCFACHGAFNGADSGRCVSCHKPADIGRLTTAGLPVTKPLTSMPFHQKLRSEDCVACHSDHAGVKRFRRQGRFDHGLLETATREVCHECHKAPTDTLHRQITGSCGKCHGQDRWTPANFDHAQYFELDRDHNVRCITCHQGNDYGRYTCFGCHEHTPDNIRRKHVKEGIRDYDDCVECHRNADEHDIRSGRSDTGGRRGERGRRRHHDD